MSRSSLRIRLTLVYGGLFLVAGAVLLGVTYVLVGEQIAHSTVRFMAKGEGDSSAAETAERTMERQREKVRSAAGAAILSQGAIALGGVGSGAVATGWLLGGRVLAPLHRVTETARRIANAPLPFGGLRERTALSGASDDVAELAEAFDTMVERLGRSFEGQQHFVANASHELRTPLTVSRALVELAVHRPDATQDVKDLGRDLLEVSARHERLIDGLLQLAGSEREIGRRSEIDLADIAAHVLERLDDAAERAGVAVRSEIRSAPMTGDALLIERLVHNLVENAVLHNVRDGSGWLRLATYIRPDDAAVLEVANTGSILAPPDLADIFEPFRRLGRERMLTGQSAGLGLSIVRSITETHGGTVTAQAREDGGLVVTVVLP